jgi:hypothetical protein
VGPRASVREAGWAPQPVYRRQVDPTASVREAGWAPGPVYRRQGGPHGQSMGGRVGPKASARETWWAPEPVCGRQGGTHSQCTGGRVGPTASVQEAGWDPQPVYRRQGGTQSQCTGGRVGSRADGVAVVEKKSCQETNPGRLASDLVTTRTEISRLATSTHKVQCSCLVRMAATTPDVSMCIQPSATSEVYWLQHGNKFRGPL